VPSIDIQCFYGVEKSYFVSCFLWEVDIQNISMNIGADNVECSLDKMMRSVENRESKRLCVPCNGEPPLMRQMHPLPPIDNLAMP